MSRESQPVAAFAQSTTTHWAVAADGAAIDAHERNPLVDAAKKDNLRFQAVF
jgi:hypothetical protein